MIGIFSIIGGILGFLLTRSFFGAFLGFLIGGFVDNTQYKNMRTKAGQNPGGGSGFGGQQSFFTERDFHRALLMLSSAVMNADGKILKSELNYVKKFMVQQFGNQRAQIYLKELREISKQDIPLHEVCLQIKSVMNPSVRLQMLHYLFGIAHADGHVSEQEMNVIKQIASYFQVSNSDFESLKAMFYKDTKSAYKILEVDPEASDAEIKKAYRKMAVKYHPDKVSHLGEEFQKGAKEKFQKVQEAYETIKKERGIS